MNDHNSTMSFDRMRNMLVRAAEIRESEQQQIFDALDEIHARMSPLESVGSIRKRLSEMPDRTETSVIAERVDEVLSKLESQDAAIASLSRAVESIVDKLATPFAQLDGRLDGVVGKMEGVVGKMDGLEDKLANIHRRLDELEQHLDKQDTKVEALPREVQTPVKERIEAAESTLRERVDEAELAVRTQLEEAQEAVQQKLSESTDAVNTKIDKSHLLLHGKIDETKEVADSGDRFDAQGARLDTLDSQLDKVSNRIEELVSRLETAENTLTGRLGELAGTLTERPDTKALDSLVRKANEDSERQHAGQLDEAMATFAELILGGAPPAAAPQAVLPRQQRRPRKTTTAKNNGRAASVDVDEDSA